MRTAGGAVAPDSKEPGEEREKEGIEQGSGRQERGEGAPCCIPTPTTTSSDLATLSYIVQTPWSSAVSPLCHCPAQAPCLDSSFYSSLSLLLCPFWDPRSCLLSGPRPTLSSQLWPSLHCKRLRYPFPRCHPSLGPPLLLHAPCSLD